MKRYQPAHFVALGVLQPESELVEIIDGNAPITQGEYFFAIDKHIAMLETDEAIERMMTQH